MRFPSISAALIVSSALVLVALSPGPAHAQGLFYYGYSGPGYYQSWPSYSWAPGYWSSPYYSYSYSSPYPYSASYRSPAYYSPSLYAPASPCQPAPGYDAATATLRPIPQAQSEVPPGATVTVADDYFGPATIHVAPGTTVRWINSGKHVHTVTADNDSFGSGDLPPGASYSIRFVQPGAYSYHCRYHAGMGMRGTVVVGSSPPSGPAGATAPGGSPSSGSSSSSGY